MCEQNLDPQEEKHQAADHEAGHFYMAVLLNLHFFCHYLTVESSPVSGQDATAGGICGIGFWHTPALDEWEGYLYGGMAAQFIGMTNRSPEEDPEFQFKKVWLQAKNDRDLYESFGGSNEHEKLSKAVKFLAPKWSFLQPFSAQLMKLGTIYCGEEELILGAILDEPEFKGAHERYRNTWIRNVSAPGHDFKTRFPNVEWNEPVADWIVRTSQPADLRGKFERLMNQRKNRA